MTRFQQAWVLVFLSLLQACGGSEGATPRTSTQLSSQSNTDPQVVVLPEDFAAHEIQGRASLSRNLDCNDFETPAASFVVRTQDFVERPGDLWRGDYQFGFTVESRESDLQMMVRSSSGCASGISQGTGSREHPHQWLRLELPPSEGEIRVWVSARTASSSYKFVVHEVGEEASIIRQDPQTQDIQPGFDVRILSGRGGGRTPLREISGDANQIGFAREEADFVLNVASPTSFSLRLSSGSSQFRTVLLVRTPDGRFHSTHLDEGETERQSIELRLPGRVQGRVSVWAGTVRGRRGQPYRLSLIESDPAAVAAPTELRPGFGEQRIDGISRGNLQLEGIGENQRPLRTGPGRPMVLPQCRGASGNAPNIVLRASTSMNLELQLIAPEGGTLLIRDENGNIQCDDFRAAGDERLQVQSLVGELRIWVGRPVLRNEEGEAYIPESLPFRLLVSERPAAAPSEGNTFEGNTFEGNRAEEQAGRRRGGEITDPFGGTLAFSDQAIRVPNFAIHADLPQLATPNGDLCAGAPAGDASIEIDLENRTILRLQAQPEASDPPFGLIALDEAGAIVCTDLSASPELTIAASFGRLRIWIVGSRAAVIHRRFRVRADSPSDAEPSRVRRPRRQPGPIAVPPNPRVPRATDPFQ